MAAPTRSGAAQRQPSSGDSPSGSGKSSAGRESQTDFRSRDAHTPEKFRQMPQSPDAEKGLLSSALLAPKEVIDLCIQSRVTPDFFHFPAHARLYEVLRDLRDKERPIDIITLTQELSDRGMLDNVGGAAAVSDLLDFIPTPANAEYYLEILREKFLLRRMILTCTEFASRSYEEQGDVRMLLDEVEKRVLEIGEERSRGNLPTIKEHVMQAVDSIDKLYKNRGGITGLSSGFSELDKLTSGLHEGEMFVVAARPSMGKTAFAMNIAEHVAVELGRPVAIFSLEMSSQQLVQRLLCSSAKIDLGRIRSGFLDRTELPKLAAAADKLAKTNIFIDDTAGLSIIELRAKARRLRERSGIELIVIDYLQLLRSTSRRAQENRQIEVSEISYGIKALAKELKLPVVVLSQLNRQPDEKGGRPMLSHLRESGSIEQDADVVAMLYRAEIYEKDEEARAEKEGEAELIIAKQRNGPIGDIPLTFLKKFTRFEDRAREKPGSSKG